MARKAVLSGGKRDELTAAALRLFLERGYEQTSVRDILQAVDGEVGMFYHYFKSKDAIFEAAVALYLQMYTQQFAALAAGASIDGLVNALLDLVEQTITRYIGLGTENLHWSTALALHQRTLLAIQPVIAERIAAALADGSARNPLGLSAADLASFLLFGISGILHQTPMRQLSAADLAGKRRTIAALAAHTLGLSQEGQA
jgi:AcrR family transcriptional regulator